MRAQNGEVAGRVTKPFLLLVGRVVLLVHHDQAQRRERSEHRGARADDDARLAAVRSPPGLAALARSEARMQHHDAGAEAPVETLDQLRGKRDLGHQHQRLPRRAARFVLCKRRRDGLQIHLGLAAARDAVEEIGREASERCADRLQDVDLRAGEHDVTRPRLNACGTFDLPLGFGPAAFRERLELRARAGAQVLRRGRALREPREQGSPAGRPPATLALEREPACRGQAPALGAFRRRGLALAQGCGQGRRQDLADWMVVVIGSPAQQIECHRIEDRGRVEHGQSALELRRIERRVGCNRDQNADQLAAAERHAHSNTRPQGRGQRLDGGQVIENASQRRIECDLEDHDLVHKNCG